MFRFFEMNYEWSILSGGKQMNNIFFRLCLYKTSNEQCDILFGFSIPTHHDVSKWKKMKTKLTEVFILECVMAKEEANNFYQSLTLGNTHDLMKNNIRMDFIKDKYRPFDEHEKAAFERLSGITEYWNQRKEQIIQSIRENPCKQNGIKSYSLQIAGIIKDEFRIDFVKCPELIGNFHEYNISNLSLFHVKSNSKDGISKIIIQNNKKKSYHVQCMIRYNDRNYIDKLYLLDKKDDQLEIESKCDIQSFCLHIYNLEGDLVYYQANGVMCHLVMNIAITSPKSVEDDYSVNLKKKASKVQRKLIEDHLNEASSFSNYKFEVGQNHGDKITSLYDECSRYYVEERYTRNDCKYVINKQIEGEIEGFDALESLIDDREFDEIWIVDPYFDVSTALKIFSRVKNSSHHIHLLTAVEWKLDKINKFAEMFACGIEVHFFKKESFHDRYIIRKSKSHMDAYMLSNSINNLAKNYPLVICELSYEVMIKVYNYLNNLLDDNSKRFAEPLVLSKAKKDDKENTHSQLYNDLSEKIRRKEAIDFKQLFDQYFLQSPNDCVMILSNFIVTCKYRKNVVTEVLQSLKSYHQKIISILWATCSKYSHVSDRVGVSQILNHYFVAITRFYKTDRVYYNALVTLFILDQEKYLNEYRNNQNSLYIDCILGYYTKFDESLYLNLIRENDYLIFGLMASHLWESSKRVENPQLFLIETISRIEDTNTRIKQIFILLIIIQNEGKNVNKFLDIADKLEQKVFEILENCVDKKELIKCFDVFKLGSHWDTSIILRGMSNKIQNKEWKSVIVNEGLKSSKENILNKMSIFNQKDIEMYFYFFKIIYPNGNTQEIKTFYDQSLFKATTKPYNFAFPNGSWYENKNILYKTICIFYMYSEFFPNDEEIRNFTNKWDQIIYEQEEDYKCMNS